MFPVIYLFGSKIRLIITEDLHSNLTKDKTALSQKLTQDVANINNSEFQENKESTFDIRRNSMHLAKYQGDTK